MSLRGQDSGRDKCHRRLVCVHLPSLGLELDPRGPFQMALPQAVSLRNCSFWRASRGGAAVRRDKGLDTGSLHPCGLSQPGN